MLIYGATTAAGGVPILLNARKKRLLAHAAVAKRLDELAAGATEFYFEERRSLEAYPPPSSDAKMRWLGFMLTILGIAMIVMGITA